MFFENFKQNLATKITSWFLIPAISSTPTALAINKSEIPSLLKAQSAYAQTIQNQQNLEEQVEKVILLLLKVKNMKSLIKKKF